MKVDVSIPRPLVTVYRDDGTIIEGCLLESGANLGSLHSEAINTAIAMLKDKQVELEQIADAIRARKS